MSHTYFSAIRKCIKSKQFVLIAIFHLCTLVIYATNLSYISYPLLIHHICLSAYLFKPTQFNYHLVGAGVASSSAIDKTATKLGNSINTPISDESQPINTTNGMPTPAVIVNNCPKLTIDPLAMDEDKYSFSSANRADPDFRVLTPKSPWLKSRATKGFQKVR